ncbi:MAG: DUF4011 domain-containing protein [Anaerolineae bacterium]|nr:DUF4011 domain-containing protein [Anaerolineae bacterium]
MESVENILEQQRKNLLDTSRRNPLLNYSLTNKSIEITTEWPEDIFLQLVSRGKSMVFLPNTEGKAEKEPESFQRYARDPSDEDEFDPDPLASDHGFHLDEFRVNVFYADFEADIDEQEEPTSRLTALKDRVSENYRRLTNLSKLSTNHASDDLMRRLKSIYNDMRRFNKELGVNPYYITLGMLEWSDPKRSQELNLAPILLIPVEIVQKNRFSNFEVQYTDEEVEFNDTLREKLREDFDISLPSQTNISPSDIQDFFALIEEIIKDYNWKVIRNKVTLTVFASSKYLMHKDLKPDSWPAESSPETNPTLSKLVHGGFQKTWQFPFQHTHLVDSLISPMENYQIYDADSSQLMAIYHIKNGHDLIIQGPPGTGKSQTITNIIAQSLGDDKTVLFVAQKETALNVVKRRLDDAGLGHLCLELHGHRTKRGTILNEIQQTLDLSYSISTQQALGDIPGLIAIRNKLNNYAEGMNTPIDGETLTPYQCFEELLRLKGTLDKADPPRLPDRDLFKHHRSLQYHQWLPKIENLQMLLSEIGIPKDNAFRFCQCNDDTFIAPEEIKQIIRQTQNALEHLQEAAVKLAAHLGAPSPTTKRQVQHLVHLSEHIFQAPLLAGLAIRSSKWQINRKEILGTVSALRKSDELQRQYNSILMPEAWSRNIGGLYEQIRNSSNPFQRFLNLPARIPDELAQLCRTEPPNNVKDQLSLLNAIRDFQSHQKMAREHEHLFKELLGEQTWREAHNDWKYLSILGNWLNKLHQTIQTTYLSFSVLEYIEAGIQKEELRDLYELVENNLKQHEIAVTSLLDHLQLDEEAQFGNRQKFTMRNFSSQDELLNTWLINISQLKDISDYNKLKKELVADGLKSVVELGEVWSKASLYLVDVVKYFWYLHLINKSGERKLELASFNRVIHEANVQKFCDLDKALLEENKSYLASKYNEAVQGLLIVEDKGVENQLKLIKRQCMNAGTKLSIRKIMDGAGKALQTLKPVFMMSPASVAEFLPPSKVKFDVIIFDEASQIRPEDAIGAILRGNQTIVVGDRFQLPPTDFFAPSTDRTDLENVTDAESILDLFYIAGVPQTTLLWHYRSQHHSLITPSNQTFYNNELIVFPSPQNRNEKLGVHFFPIFGSIYDRGRSRTNPVEARIVAQAVIHHAINDPDLSLGVVALHKNQADAIEHEINLLRDQNPQCEDFFEEENKFLVTNLENVQGDEKEVIFVSIGYGFSKDGRLTLNFGPISKEGGHRRLNVLTTRAKKQCVIFSSIRGRDILERNPSNLGARFLAEYLEYAETGLTISYEEMHQALQKSETYEEGRERLIKLISVFNQRFDLEDLREFCLYLDIDYENLPGDTKQRKARELALYFYRRENISRLIQVGKQHRLDIDWDGLYQDRPIEVSTDVNLLKDEINSQLLRDSFSSNQIHAPRMSQIEEEIVTILEANGYCVKTYIGPPNAAIPIAVLDEKEQIALLGIELDGPNYYRSRTARDRDRLRQQELEKLNWKIHRIWIIDWYYNKQREIDRLIQAINNIGLNTT